MESSVQSAEMTAKRIVDELNCERSIEENWVAFNSVFEKYIQHFEGQIYLIHGDIKKDEFYELSPISRNYLERLKNYDFRAAIEQVNIDFWFDLSQQA